MTVPASRPAGAETLSWRVVPPLISTALMYIGAGALSSLLPLRFSALGFSPAQIGLLAAFEAAGFLVGCLNAHKIIRPVGLERAYATFAGLKAVAILSLHFASWLPVLALIRFLIGLNAAGLSVIVESWLNALVANSLRGRVLTIYVLVIGLFFGIGQLLGERLVVTGPDFLFIAGMATTLALVPLASINVRAPESSRRVTLDILGALRTSPASVLACLLNGLVLTAFLTVGPLFGQRIGLPQDRILELMACVSLGGLVLQWPIGYLSDKIDRLYALIGLAAGTLGVSVFLSTVHAGTAFVLLALAFAVFGGMAESLYAMGVAHANDRARSNDHVALSSSLLFVWSVGAAIGPATGSFVIQLTHPQAFFIYAGSLALAYALFGIWRLSRRPRYRRGEAREEFHSYPHTSPEVYNWAPYHLDSIAEPPPESAAESTPDA
jgi:MFS family permease